MESYLFSFQMMHKSQFQKLTLMTGFVTFVVFVSQRWIKSLLFRCCDLTASFVNGDVGSVWNWLN